MGYKIDLGKLQRIEATQIKSSDLSEINLDINSRKTKEY